MSLRSMAVMRAEAEGAAAEAGASEDVTESGRATPELAAAGGGANGKKLGGAGDQLIALIPAEAVALFILLIGLTADTSLGLRGAALAMVAAFSVAWTALCYFEAKGGRVGADWPVFEMAVGTAAFLAWSTSVPAAPFSDLDLPTWAGPVLVTVTSGVLVLLLRARAIWAKPAGDERRIAAASGAAPSK